MARRNDLAGLAALGALGLMMSKRQDGSSVPVQDLVGTPVSGDDQYNPDVRSVDRNEDYGLEGRRTGPVGMWRAPVAASPRQRGSAVVGNPGGDYDMGVQPRATPTSRRLSSSEAMAALDAATGVRPMDPNADRGPNAVTGSELGRNVRNTLGALTPLGGGVGSAVIEGAMLPRAQRLYNQAAAARRSAEGFSPAEAMARRRLMEEAAFEGGMKKGGKVKKKVAPKPTASSRADGIAQRGKTRGVMR